MFGLSCFYFASRFLCIFAAFSFSFGKEYEPTDVCAKLNNKEQSVVVLLAYKLSVESIGGRLCVHLCECGLLSVLNSSQVQKICLYDPSMMEKMCARARC